MLCYSIPVKQCHLFIVWLLKINAQAPKWFDFRLPSRIESHNFQCFSRCIKNGPNFQTIGLVYFKLLSLTLLRVFFSPLFKWSYWTTFLLCSVPSKNFHFLVLNISVLFSYFLTNSSGLSCHKSHSTLQKLKYLSLAKNITWSRLYFQSSNAWTWRIIQSVSVKSQVQSKWFHSRTVSLKWMPRNILFAFFRVCWEYFLRSLGINNCRLFDFIVSNLLCFRVLTIDCSTSH